jgi:hypothetical protein
LRAVCTLSSFPWVWFALFGARNWIGGHQMAPAWTGSSSSSPQSWCSHFCCAGPLSDEVVHRLVRHASGCSRVWCAAARGHTLNPAVGILPQARLHGSQPSRAFVVTREAGSDTTIGPTAITTTSSSNNQIYIHKSNADTNQDAFVRPQCIIIQ